MARKNVRFIELQRQVKIAKDALDRIAGGCRDPERVATDARYEMYPLDSKAPLQGLVGHGARSR
jgi:hypothetical protein